MVVSVSSTMLDVQRLIYGLDSVGEAERACKGEGFGVGAGAKL
jgi:hypothetical protein